ncbi:MAG: DUF1815 family protein [Synechococcaceae cyanobacterium]
MFSRLAEQYRAVVDDLVLSLEALARCLQDQGRLASCYTCGEAGDRLGTAFVAELGDSHLVRFRVSDCGISWLESRNGHELVTLEGAEAIQEMQRVANALRSFSSEAVAIPHPAAADSNGVADGMTTVAEAEAA